MDEFFVRNRLSAYIDGDLPAAEAREVEAALARNPGLKAEYDALKEAVDLLRDHGPVKMPAEAARRLDERLARERTPGGLQRLWYAGRPQVLALAALLVVAVGYVAWSGREQAPVAGVATTKDAVAKDSPDANAPTEVATKGGDAVAKAKEPTPTEPTSVDPSTAEGAPLAGNGVLGDEGFAAAVEDARRKREQGPPPGQYVGPPAGKSWTPKDIPSNTGDKLGYDVEQYQAMWEQNAKAEEDREAAAPSPAAPFRYHVRAGVETMLQDLDRLATSLGGRLVDATGRRLAVHMLDQGEIKTARVILPGAKVQALADSLRAIGDVETMAADRALLKDPPASVTVVVELERE